MKKILFIFLIQMSIIYAQESTVKVVYDLTSKDLATFELKILKSIVANKTYYESKLKELEVAVVIHGGAYKFFLKDPVHSKFKEDIKLLTSHKELAKRIKYMAESYEVKFLICGVGMEKHALVKSDVYDFVEVIKNASVGLIDKQSVGYAYIPVN